MMKEKNIEPIRPLVLLFAVACLSLLLMIFSVTELPITDDFSLRIFSFDDFMNRAKVQTVDIGFVKEMEEKIDSLENVSIIENVEILPKKDTIKANTNSSTNAEKTEISKKAIAEKAEKMDNIRREIE